MSAASQKQVKRLQKLIKPYGLRIVDGDHRKIINERNQAVYWFSGSPSCPFFADNIVRDLVGKGLIPKHLRRIKIR